MIFKVGDTVRILGGENPQDENFTGKIAKVKAVDDTVYILDIPNKDYAIGFHLAWEWELEPYPITTEEGF